MASTFAGKYTGVADGGPGGAAVDGAVFVYLHGTTTPATLYTDRTKATTGPNPVTADTSGYFVVYADPATYDVLVAGTTTVIVVLPDAAELASGVEPGGMAGAVQAKLSAANDDVGWAANLTVTSVGVGMNGNAPVGKAGAIASPSSDTVGTKAAIDAIRAALTNLGVTF